MKYAEKYKRQHPDLGENVEAMRVPSELLNGTINDELNYMEDHGSLAAWLIINQVQFKMTAPENVCGKAIVVSYENSQLEALPGDYLVKDSTGVYPMSQIIFEALYQKV